MPHPGHCLTRAIKDLFPRYRTMRGYLCERKAGWDTHGLPVEVEVCKELGIHSKEEIETYGVEPFIHRCQESVWRYMQEWERLTERLGFWIHLDEAYVTYHQSYVESVWWSLKEPVRPRAACTRATRSSGGGRKAARRCPAAKSGRAIARWPTRACMCGFRCSDRSAGRNDQTDANVAACLDDDALDAAEQPVRGGASGAGVRDRASIAELAGERLIVASALVETIAAKVKRRAESRIRLAREASSSASAICRRSTTTTRRMGNGWAS